jgi:N-acetylmuramate 1-kinase
MENLEQTITKLTGRQFTSFKILAGDASTRRYYRAEIPNESWVIMDQGCSFTEDTDPFLCVQAYLKKQLIPVPEILDCFPEYGLIILQDLGNQTLQNEYRENQITALENLFPQVQSILARLQNECTNSINCKCPAFQIEFDYETFMYELQFFRENFLENYLNIKLDGSEKELLHRSFDWISRNLIDEPRVFTHRDYHSRNLMVRDKKIYVLDFQDARLGLPYYDLASILRDAYINLPESYIEAVLEAVLPKFPEPVNDHLNKREIFSVMCIQRNIKALGTFGFQATIKRNPDYVEYIPTLQSHLTREFAFLNRNELTDFRRFLESCINDSDYV